MVRLAGKLGCIGEAYPWVYHLMPRIYASIAYALRGNESFLVNTSYEFRQLVKRAKAGSPHVDDDMRDVNFAMKRACRKKLGVSSLALSHQRWWKSSPLSVVSSSQEQILNGNRPWPTLLKGFLPLRLGVMHHSLGEEVFPSTCVFCGISFGLSL